MQHFPDFTQIPFKDEQPAGDIGKWEAGFQDETGQTPDALSWDSLEKIKIKPLYTEADLSS